MRRDRDYSELVRGLVCALALVLIASTARVEAAGPDAEPFVISIPPPNVTGVLHQGHALFVALEDLMIRYQRMRGRAALWVPGTDHAGIATQMVVERQLMERQQPGRRDMGRAKFLERVWEWKAESGGVIVNQLKRLGASCDWSRERFTMDEGLSRAVVEGEALHVLKVSERLMPLDDFPVFLPDHRLEVVAGHHFHQDKVGLVILIQREQRHDGLPLRSRGRLRRLSHGCDGRGRAVVPHGGACGTFSGKDRTARAL